MPTVEEVTFQFDQAFTAGINAAASAVQKATGALDSFAAAADSTNAKVTNSANGFDKVVARMDPVTRAYNTLSSAQDKMTRMQAAAADALAAGGAQADVASRALDNQATVVARLQARFDALSDSVSASSRITQASMDAIDALRAKYVPLEGAMQQSIAAQAEINQLDQSGVLSKTEAAAAIAKVTSAYAAQLAAVQESIAAQKEMVALQGQSVANNFAGVSIQSTATGVDFGPAAASASAFSTSLGNLQSKWVPLIAAQAQAAASLSEIDTLQINGLLTQSQYATAVDKATLAVRTLNGELAAETEAQNAVAVAAAAAQARMNAYIVSSNRSAVSSVSSSSAGQGIANAYAGFSTDSVKSAADSASVFTTAANQARAAVDSLYATSMKYADALDQIGKLERQGIVNTTTANALRAQANSILDGGTAAQSRFGGSVSDANDTVAKQRLALQALTPQVIQFATSIQSGISPLTAFVQQGHQVLDVSTAMGLGVKDFTGAVSGLAARLAPLVPLLAAIAIPAVVLASFAAMAVYAENQQEALAKLSQQLRATRTDYTDLASAVTSVAKAQAATGTISKSDATSAGSAFAAVPTVGANQLSALINQAKDLAAVMGQTVPQAAKTLADALNDPEKAAESFAQQGLTGVNELLAQQVTALQNSGDKLGAYKLLQDQLTASIGGAGKAALSDYQRSLESLSAAWSTPINGAKTLGQSIGDGIMVGVTASINALASLISKLNELKAYGLFGGDDFTPVGSASSSAAPTGSVAAAITSIGNQLNAPADVISLAQRIAPVESSTGMLNAQGQLQTSSVGALGAMQVMPANANGNDLTTLTGNVTAAEQLLIHLYSKYSGNQALVAMAYNWGEGNVDKFLAGKQDVPQGVQDYTQQVTGGQIYGSVANATMTQQVNQALVSPDDRTAAQVRTETEALTQAQGALVDLQNQYKAGSVSQSAFDDGTVKLNERIQEHQAALNNLRDPLQQLSHDQDLATQSAAAYSGGQAAMIDADQKAEQAARDMGQAHATSAQFATAEANAQAALTEKFNVSVDAIDRQTVAQNKLTAGYDGTTGTLTAYINAEQAAEKARETAPPSTAEYARQVGILTNVMNAASASAANLATAQQLYAQNLNLDYIKTETSLIGQNKDAVATQLAVLQARNGLLAKSADVTNETSQAYLKNVAATQDATNAYQHQQQVLSDVTGSLSSMADTISGDITQAFIEGSASGVNFKSVLQGVETQIASLVVKMALINPLLNAIDGGTRTTLSDIGSLLSSTGAASSLALGSAATGTAGLSAGSVASGLGVVGSISTSGASGLSGLGSLLGLGSGAETTITSTAQAIGPGTLGVLNGATNTATSSLGSIGSTISSALPYVGVAAAVIPLIAGLFGGPKKNPYTIDNLGLDSGYLSLGKSWNQAQNDTITAQAQQDIANINSTLKSVGALYNGGDTGQIGSVRDDPNNKDASLQSVSVLDVARTSGLTTSDQTFQAALDDSKALLSAMTDVSSYDTAITTLKSMADTVDALGAKVENFNESAGTVRFDGVMAGSQYSDAASKAINTALAGQTFTTSDLTSAIQAAMTFADTTYPGLVKATTQQSETFADQIKDLATTYASAEAAASSYGMSVSALQDTFTQLSTDLWNQKQSTLDQQDATVNAAYMAATGNQEGADLANFDVSALQQKQALISTYQDIYGDAFAQNTTFARDMTDLDTSLAAQRLAIQQKYTDDAASAAATAAAAEASQLSDAQKSVQSVFDSIATYTSSLVTSDASPLSAQDKYDAANSNFQMDLAAAQSGNVTAAGNLTSDAQTFLGQSQIYNGSGVQYASDYQTVLADLASIANVSISDQLTNSEVTAALETQTDTLNDSLQQLIAITTKAQQQSAQAARRGTTGQ